MPTLNNKKLAETHSAEEATSQSNAKQGAGAPRTTATQQQVSPSAMDSLLSAATTVFTPGPTAAPAAGGNSKKRKRKRGTHGERTPAGTYRTNGLQRQTSALDVLPDQAGAVSSQRTDGGVSSANPLSASTVGPLMTQTVQTTGRSPNTLMSASEESSQGSNKLPSIILVPSVNCQTDGRPSSGVSEISTSSNASASAPSQTLPEAKRPVPQRLTSDD